MSDLHVSRDLCVNSHFFYSKHVTRVLHVNFLVLNPRHVSVVLHVNHHFLHPRHVSSAKLSWPKTNFQITTYMWTFFSWLDLFPELYIQISVSLTCFQVQMFMMCEKHSMCLNPYKMSGYAIYRYMTVASVYHWYEKTSFLVISFVISSHWTILCFLWEGK
jgi:hypothetical protein